MNNKDRIIEFKKTMKISEKFFSRVNSEKYNRDIEIIWSDNIVADIIKLRGRRIAALNFADGYDRGGLVWEGVKTQEEDLCRSSNLYLALSAIEYPIDGSLVYSKDVMFFRDENLIWLKEPVRCDIISCSSLVCTEDEIETKRRMKMIIESARVHGVEVLILGKWGCGAFGNDWNVFKRWWDEIINETL